MPRALDMVALRSLAAIVDSGGVTRAASKLNLTQSAVSMQIKRLEESLGLDLLDRTGRRVVLTGPGEQLLSYARRMLALNDEALARLTNADYEGEITLGVPHDILYPAIPPVLAAFAQHYPRLRIRLLSQPTRALKEMFARGECDVILTTEARPEGPGETIVTLPLIWAAATGGGAWRSRPLPFAFCRNCIFSPIARTALDQAGIEWISIVDSASDRAAEAAVIADLAVYVVLHTALAPGMSPVPRAAELPDLPDQSIVLYRSTSLQTGLSEALAELLRENYGRLTVSAPVAAE